MLFFFDTVCFFLADFFLTAFVRLFLTLFLTTGAFFTRLVVDEAFFTADFLLLRTAFLP